VNPDSTPFPQPPPLVEPRYDDPTVLPWAPPPRPKFQHRYTRHLIFFALTFFTTTFAPAFEYVFASIGTDVPALAGFTWEMFRAGLWYSIPLLIILGAHEFGHYFACRYHDVDATLPYFLPAPLPLTGTFGAVIRIREAFPSRKALFDIGVAGPIGGFVMLVPFLVYGIMHSRVIPMPHGGDMLWLGEPLLLKGLMRLQFGNLGDDFTIVLHPVGQAAWWGMLATALNLMPFGQLDGGHLAYAVLGRRASWISMGTLAAALVLTFNSSSWVSVTVMMLVMSVFLGFRHPRVRDEITPIGRNRLIVFALAWVIFALCFMPVPLAIVNN
jgi:membrane-associated protease RseP (regulator of RpoE activity)